MQLSQMAESIVGEHKAARILYLVLVAEQGRKL